MRLINTHDQLVAAGGGIAIVRAPRLRGEGFGGWSIYRVSNLGREFATDANAAWYRKGRKTFDAPERDRGKAALARAEQWCREKFGETGPWVRNRMGDYVPERVALAYPLEGRRRRQGS